MRPLRVTLVADTFPPQRDDRACTVRHTADELIDRGHLVQIVTASPGVATFRGAPVLRITGFRQRGSRIAAALAAFRPDLMHATSPDLFGRKALKQALLADLPTIVTEQSPVPSFLPGSYVEQVIGRAGRLLVTSVWAQRQLAERGILAHVWQPGADLVAFRPGLRDDKLHRHWSRADKIDGPRVVVGYVGGLHKRHGVRRLAELAHHRDLRVVVIGAGPQDGWLRDRLPDAKFLAPLSTGDLGTAIASLDVLAHPGKRQTCGHALRAAAASGIPAVAPGCAAAPEVVDDRITGLLFDADHSGGLAEATIRLIDPALRAELGRGARSRAELRDWSVAGTELVEIHYPEVLSARRRTSALAS
jgi:phosphatidylinositol alpha 1,6-mannosyltransferase